VEWIGEGLSLLTRLPAAVTEMFTGAARPAVIVGAGALKVPGAQAASLALVGQLNLLREGWNGYNVLHTAAARMGGLMLGYAQPQGMAALIEASPKLLFLLGADEGDFSAFASSFKVYVGHHGDRGASIADVILPGAAYTEKHGTYVNLEGRVQLSEKAVDAPGDAREDWSIFRALSEVLGRALSFDSFGELRRQLREEHPEFAQTGLVSYPWAPPALDAGELKAGSAVAYPIQDFYLTNPIARSSPTLQRCSEEILHGATFQEAAE
jgi:NADH-quinone oxidoreductase subunit G